MIVTYPMQNKNIFEWRFINFDFIWIKVFYIDNIIKKVVCVSFVCLYIWICYSYLCSQYKIILSCYLWRGMAINVFFFFLSGFFFREHLRFSGQQEKGKCIYLTSLYHFHPLHIHLDISRAITAESSLLRTAS